MNHLRIGLFLIIIGLISSCQKKQFADVIFINGIIATMDISNPSAEAIAVIGDTK